MLIREDGMWILKSEDGKKTLGKYTTKGEALEREKQVKMFEYIKKRKESDK